MFIKNTRFRIMCIVFRIFFLNLQTHDSKEEQKTLILEMYTELNSL